MSEIKFLIVGTRGSKLALAQTQLVIDALKEKYPTVKIRPKVILTKGDTNQSPIPLDTIGKNWFTAEIEQALLKNEIDIAVHSMKDLPPQIPKGLTTLPVLKRGDPRDAFISKSGLLFRDLPHGAIIGTDSTRRRVLLLEGRPDITVKSIRGNIDTRLKKLHDEPYDAIVLAAAGLERAGMLGVVTEFFDPLVFIPAIGQGILAAQAREDREEMIGMLQNIQDAPTTIAAHAEQTFSAAVGGGCKLPIGCYAYIDGNTMIMNAFIKHDADAHIRRNSMSGPIASSGDIAEKMARTLM